MFPHAGCSNHGCEAIVRSTAAMFSEKKDKMYLYTSNPDSDRTFGLDQLCELIEIKDKNIGAIQKKWFALKEKISGIHRDILEICYRHSSAIVDRRNMIALSIGGDNYCYSGMQHVLSEQMKVFQHNKIPSVLWGCSIEEQYLNDRVISDLKAYDVITARESLTIETLEKIGLFNKVVACSDPAFTLGREEVGQYSNKLSSKNVIGINVSPLVRRFNAYPEAAYRNFYRLTEYILKNTDCEIAFIPHVRQEGNDDLTPIKKLAGEFNSSRIFCVEEDFNCMQLKDIIARCRMFIGCRTHSTIAAYSTCVPTLVVGYSIKARGICKDLFGDYDDLLVDVREFKDDYDLVKKFQAFIEREEELRTHLQTIMPEYKKRAYLAKDAVEKLSK